MRSPSQLLTAPPSSFSKAEWQLLRAYGIVNGYWPRNAPILRKLLKWLAPMFREANADLHDFSFKKWGSIEDFHKSNRWFFMALVRDSITIKKHSFLLFLYYIFLSLVFYEAVELFWKRYFNFSYKEYNSEQTRD